MADYVSVPIKIVNGEKWGDLSSLALTHEVCGERVDHIQKFSFQGNHRVRLYKFKKNIHWRIPVTLDISEVAAAADVQPARKQAPGRR